MKVGVTIECPALSPCGSPLAAQPRSSRQLKRDRKRHVCMTLFPADAFFFPSEAS